MINLRARISICGMISQYNATAPVPGPYNLINIITRRAKMEDFIVIDYLPRAQEAIPELIIRQHLAPMSGNSDRS
ncbi:MAG TPA: hypothetical protein VE715_08630 [Blastocatellia bacterium]|nr:hypothetical protein [Blastocatellia bacterium]